MRITSLFAVIATGFTLAVTGCGGPMEPEQPTDSEPAVSEELPSERIVTEQAMCPISWYCSVTGVYYSTATQCSSECGGTTCYRTYMCHRFCICP